MKKTIQYSLILILTILISCSKDDSNSPPQIADQQFEIEENATNNSIIGTIEASDAEGDNISYILEEGNGFNVNANTGVITVADSDLIDFETQTSRDFEISVSDGEFTQMATITVNIINVEDGPLSNVEKELLDYIPYLALGQHPSSQTMTIARRWTQTINLYAFGSALTTAYENRIAEAANLYNSLSTASNFSIQLTQSSGQSNVQIYRGPKQDLQQIWPDMYDLVNGAGFIGYAIYNFGSNGTINGGRIWVGTDDEGTLKHEIGHVLGFGHSNKCLEPDHSIMCAPSADDLLPIDRDAFRFYYHADVPAGLNETQLRAQLEQVFISG